MPPKRIQVQPASRRPPPASNYFTAAYRELTSEENFSVVVSVSMFGVSFAPFLRGGLGVHACGSRLGCRVEVREKLYQGQIVPHMEEGEHKFMGLSDSLRDWEFRGKWSVNALLI